MSIFGKIFNRLAFRCLCAICIGIAVVALFTGMLMLYGEAQETPPQAAATSLQFPENEKMLQALSNQLAREGAALSGVEPAAGN